VASIPVVTTETIHVSGIRCERCVSRLGAALEGHEGLDSANATLMGDVILTWDEQRTSRDELLAAMAKAGFREQVAGMDATPGSFPTS
jgi:copper chaperone CopZ